MMNARERSTVVARARQWIGTPFHDNAQVMGSGVDCAHLLHAVYTECGLISDLDIENYSPQWFLHRDEERFLRYVLQVSHEIPTESLQPGDMVVYKIGRTYAHGAIVVDWPKSIIHAHLQSGCVIETPADYGDLLNKPVKAFTLRV